MVPTLFPQTAQRKGTWRRLGLSGTIRIACHKKGYLHPYQLFRENTEAYGMTPRVRVIAGLCMANIIGLAKIFPLKAL
jgi:hypothetical protein